MTVFEHLKVALVGAGVSGLRSALEFRREGHEVVVYEKSDQIGGTWVYTPEVESDALGLDPNRNVVHSSLYASLRTNSPRCLMGFTDYPFKRDEDGPQTNFPGHGEFLEFLQDFAREFGLLELVRFNTEVIRIERICSENDQWVVETRSGDGSSSSQLFDAVVICNGHNTQPRLAKISGIEEWPGRQIHSHNYRVPEPFKDEVVLVIGFGPSTFDIAVEIAEVAKEVHVSTRGLWTQAMLMKTHQNLWMHSEIHHCHKDGKVTFQDTTSAAVDVILHCTGYNYSFPFLKTNGIVSIDENRVGPLYKHVFPPQLAPRLSFVGIPRRSINIPMIELQARWVARVVSGKVLLPSKEEMLKDVEEFYRHMEQNRIPKHHTHTLPLEGVGEYLKWLSDQIGEAPLDKKLSDLFVRIGELIGDCWVGFRERAERLLLHIE